MDLNLTLYHVFELSNDDFQVFKANINELVTINSFMLVNLVQPSIESSMTLVAIKIDTKHKLTKPFASNPNDPCQFLLSAGCVFRVKSVEDYPSKIELILCEQNDLFLMIYIDQLKQRFGSNYYAKFLIDLEEYDFALQLLFEYCSSNSKYLLNNLTLIGIITEHHWKDLTLPILINKFLRKYCEQSSVIEEKYILVWIYNFYGHLYFRKKNYRRALVFYEKQMSIIKTMTSAALSMFEGLIDMAHCHVRLLEIPQALNLFQIVYSKLDTLFPSNNYRLVKQLSYWIGDMQYLLYIDDLDNRVEIMDETIREYDHILIYSNEMNRKTIKEYHQLSSKRIDYLKSQLINYYFKSSSISHLADIHFKLATHYLFDGVIKDGVNQLKIVLRIHLNHFSIDHPRIALDYYHLSANIYAQNHFEMDGHKRQRCLKQAKRFIQLSREVFEKNLPWNHFLLGEVNNLQGILEYHMKDYPAAHRHLTIAVDIRRQWMRDWYIAEIYKILAIVHFKMGTKDEAVKYLKEAIKIYVNEKPIIEKKLEEIYKILVIILKLNQQEDQARKYLRSAMIIHRNMHPNNRIRQGILNHLLENESHLLWNELIIKVNNILNLYNTQRTYILDTFFDENQIDPNSIVISMNRSSFFLFSDHFQYDLLCLCNDMKYQRSIRSKNLPFMRLFDQSNELIEYIQTIQLRDIFLLIIDRDELFSEIRYNKLYQLNYSKKTLKELTIDPFSEQIRTYMDFNWEEMFC